MTRKPGDLVRVKTITDIWSFDGWLDADPPDLVGRLGVVAGPLDSEGMYPIWLEGFEGGEAVPLLHYELERA